MAERRTLASLMGKKPPVGKSADLARILALPRRPRVEPDTATSEALINMMTETYGLGDRKCRCAEIQRARKIAAKPCLKRLNYAQAWMLYEIGLYGGLVAHAATGIGKTLVDIVAPLAMADCQTAVLFVPSTLMRQLVTEYLLVAEHFRVPSLTTHAGTKSDCYYVQGAPALHALPYSRFQRPEGTVILDVDLQPDFIIADECQNLASIFSARGVRFMRYYAHHGNTRLAAWSGTLTDDEIQDYDKFCALALREGSPLPLDPEVVDEWGTAINPDMWQAPAGALKAFCGPGEEMLDGFSRRLVETPGFVVTSGASIDAELEIAERMPPEIPNTPLADPRAPGIPILGIPKGQWPGVKAALDYLRSTWRRPDGELLIDAMSVARTARELACGLFLRWKFENGETEKQILEWLAARYEWRQELRDKLKRREPYLDSPFLCANAAIRAWGTRTDSADFDDEGDEIELDLDPGLPAWKAETWPRWATIKDAVRPVTEAIRLDPYLARDAADWALQNRGIVWYSTVAFGTWVSEISGLPMHGGGPGAEERIGAEKGDRSIVASSWSHGTGRDGLQRLFSTQLVAQFPSSAVRIEQLLGRLSRIGQQADKVRAEIYRHTPETRAAFDAAFRKTEYVQRTMCSPQKLKAGWSHPE